MQKKEIGDIELKKLQQLYTSLKSFNSYNDSLKGEKLKKQKLKN